MRHAKRIASEMRKSVAQATRKGGGSRPLWGYRLPSLRKGWHECPPARFPQVGIGSISPSLKLWGLTAGGGITLGTNAAPQGAKFIF